MKELSDLYASEQQLIPALERFSALATNSELKRAFDHHRLEPLDMSSGWNGSFDRSVPGRDRGAHDAVVGIITEAERLLKHKMDPDVRDAWLIASAQRAEHIEIANYGRRGRSPTIGCTHAGAAAAADARGRAQRRREADAPGEAIRQLEVG